MFFFSIWLITTYFLVSLLFFHYRSIACIAVCSFFFSVFVAVVFVVYSYVFCVFFFFICYKIGLILSVFPIIFLKMIDKNEQKCARICDRVILIQICGLSIGYFNKILILIIFIDMNLFYFFISIGNFIISQCGTFFVLIRQIKYFLYGFSDFFLCKQCVKGESRQPCLKICFFYSSCFLVVFESINFHQCSSDIV